MHMVIERRSEAVQKGDGTESRASRDWPVAFTGTAFARTLNGTAIAISRAIIAILKNHQEADGSVAIPAPLVPCGQGPVRADAGPELPPGQA